MTHKLLSLILRRQGKKLHKMVQLAKTIGMAVSITLLALAVPILVSAQTPCPPTQAPIPGGPSDIITNPRPTFSWSAVPGATSYTLYVLRVSDETVILRQTEITGTSFTPTAPLPSGIDLRWKVKGESSCGPGPYSPSIVFRVDRIPCPPNTPPTPRGPSGTISDPMPTFSWTAVNGASTYTLYVLKVSDESVVLRQTEIAGTSFTPGTPLPTDIDFRWKVKGESSCGPGPYSPSVNFRIGQAPCPPTDAPNPISPSETISNPKPTFSWSAVAGATTYTLYVLKVSDESVVLRQINITGTSFTTVTALPIGIDLRWKVKGESSCGPGPYSPSVVFRIGSTPCPPTEAPTANSPSGTISNPRPAFSWSAVAGATTYTLYVLKVSDESAVLRQTEIAGTSFTPGTPLPAGMDFRWKIKGESSCGPGPYSPSINFRIGQVSCPPTDAPNPISPSETINNPKPTFSWSAVAGATTYTLYVLKVSDESVMLRQINITGTSFTAVTALPIGIDLRWKVKGESSCGPGPYSPSVVFRIGATPCPPTEAPTASGPSGTINNSRPTFSWSAVAGATTYTLYVLKVSDESVVLRQTEITGTSFTSGTPLPNGIDLRWKVKGESSCGPGPYSPSVNFRIDQAPCPPTDAPNPISPSETISNPKPTFSWSAVAGATTYTLYVLKVSDESVVLRQTEIAGTSFAAATSLPIDIDLRWKVKGESSCGPGPYSLSVAFKIGQVPCPPTEAPTANGPSGTINNTKPTFSWSAVAGATTYTLYVLKVSDESVVLRQINITGTSFTAVTPLPIGIDLRWKVKGESSCGPGPYSPSVAFRIDQVPCPPTEAPTPSGPSGTINNPKPTFSWSAVAGATTYTLYVLKVSDESVVLRQINITGTSFTAVTALPIGIDLRWKVKAESSCGPGPYSPSVTFRVQ